MTLETLSKIEAVNTKNIEAMSITAWHFFPMMKIVNNRKFIELDFSENLTIRPKVEFQFAHFSNKLFTVQSQSLLTNGTIITWVTTLNMMVFSSTTFWEISSSITTFLMKICEYKGRTHVPSTGKKMYLDFYNHCLMNLIKGSYLWSEAASYYFQAKRKDFLQRISLWF